MKNPTVPVYREGILYFHYIYCKYVVIEMRLTQDKMALNISRWVNK